MSSFGTITIKPSPQLNVFAIIFGVSPLATAANHPNIDPIDHESASNFTDKCFGKIFEIFFIRPPFAMCAADFTMPLCISGSTLDAYKNDGRKNSSAICVCDIKKKFIISN